MDPVSVYPTAKLLLYSSMTLYSVSAQVSSSHSRMPCFLGWSSLCELLPWRLPWRGHSSWVQYFPRIHLCEWRNSYWSWLRILLFRGRVLRLQLSSMSCVPSELQVLPWAFLSSMHLVWLWILPLLSQLSHLVWWMQCQSPDLKWYYWALRDKQYFSH